MRPVLFLADVDDTLVSENTTVGFVEHVLAAAGDEQAADAVRALGDRRGANGIALAALHRLTGIDRARPRILAHLRGRSRADLQTVARAYVSGLLDRSAIPPAIARLERARAAGARVVLVTSTVDPVAAALAHRLDADYRSSTLAWEGDRCTGALAADLTGAKLDAVEDLLDGAREVTVMTDNRTDRDLLARADHRIVVVRHRRDAAWWADLAPDVLDVEAR